MTAVKPVWIGWLEVELCLSSPMTSVSNTSEPARSVGPVLMTLDVSVRLDIVSFWLASRTVAVADRDALAAWFRRPEIPLVVDDLEFVIVDRQLCLLVDGVGPYSLSTGSASELVSSL